MVKDIDFFKEKEFKINNINLKQEGISNENKIKRQKVLSKAPNLFDPFGSKQIRNMNNSSSSGEHVRPIKEYKNLGYFNSPMVKIQRKKSDGKNSINQKEDATIDLDYDEIDIATLLTSFKDTSETKEEYFFKNNINSIRKEKKGETENHDFKMLGNLLNDKLKVQKRKEEYWSQISTKVQQSNLIKKRDLYEEYHRHNEQERETEIRRRGKINLSTNDFCIENDKINFSKIDSKEYITIIKSLKYKIYKYRVPSFTKEALFALEDFINVFDEKADSGNIGYANCKSQEEIRVVKSLYERKRREEISYGLNLIGHLICENGVKSKKEIILRAISYIMETKIEKDIYSKNFTQE